MPSTPYPNSFVLSVKPPSDVLPTREERDDFFQQVGFAFQEWFGNQATTFYGLTRINQSQVEGQSHATYFYRTNTQLTDYEIACLTHEAVNHHPTHIKETDEGGVCVSSTWIEFSVPPFTHFQPLQLDLTSSQREDELASIRDFLSAPNSQHYEVNLYCDVYCPEHPTPELRKEDGMCDWNLVFLTALDEDATIPELLYDLERRFPDQMLPFLEELPDGSEFHLEYRIPEEASIPDDRAHNPPTWDELRLLPNEAPYPLS